MACSEDELGALSRYRCSKCKQEVAVTVNALTVLCSRCGQLMRPLEQEPEHSVKRAS